MTVCFKIHTGKNACATKSLFNLSHTNFVGQVGNLRPIGNRSVSNSGSTPGGLPIRCRLPTCPTRATLCENWGTVIGHPCSRGDQRVGQYKRLLPQTKTQACCLAENLSRTSPDNS